MVNQGREEDTPVKPKKVCLHGQSDEEVVKLVVEGLVRSATEERERKEETEGDSSCPKAALPGSDYCIRREFASFILIKMPFRRPKFTEAAPVPKV